MLRVERICCLRRQKVGARLSTIHIKGPARLSGEISIQGSKNAVLPMMAAAILHKGITVLTNVPMIQDVECMVSILNYIGCRCNRKGSTVEIDGTEIERAQIPDHFVSQMRSSIIVLGALLGRVGEGESRYPGGCLIGARPIDIHLQVLECLGAHILEEDGQITARAPSGGLVGAEIRLRYPSVGATEQALLAGVLARGMTIVYGAAREPEIGQLCDCLNRMGARVRGAGTGILVIEGVEELRDSRFAVRGDRIVAGTYLSAVMAAGGKAWLKEVRPGELELPLNLMQQAGAVIRRDEVQEEIFISMNRRPGGLLLETGPYPAFPTDLQSPFMAFLAAGDGESRIREQVFEGRFATVEELKRMGGRIYTEGREAVIQGTYPLIAGRVTARDLRGGAALAVAALAAEGETVIEDCRHVERGYEDLCRDLRALGAQAYWG